MGEPSPLTSDVTVHDLGDVTLLPGLVRRAHAPDLGRDPEAVAHVSEADDEALLGQAQAAASAALAVGITTVRDARRTGYAAVRLRDRWRADPAAGPEILAAGPPITIRGGHCGFLGGAAESEQELRAAVRERVEHGVDVVKVMATGGEMTPGGKSSYESQYGIDQLRVIADAAHGCGLPVAAHAHGAAGATDAVDAGFDSIEHGGFWTDTSAEVPDGVIERMLAAGTFVVLATAGRGLPDPSQFPPGIATRLSAIVAVIAQLWRSGVRIAYASDAGIGPGKEHDVLVHSLPRALLAAPTSVAVLRATDIRCCCRLRRRGPKGTTRAGVRRRTCSPSTATRSTTRTRSPAVHTVVRAGSIVRSPGGTAADVPTRPPGPTTTALPGPLRSVVPFQR